jgi:hypothetical protein
VLATAVLSTLADAWLATKSLLRRRGHADRQPLWAHLRNFWTLLARTRLGTRPTR